jgi:uncharacterized membrane protein
MVQGGDSVGNLTKSIEIQASADEVFNFINDFEKMNKVHEGFTQAKLTSNEPFGVGTTAHFVGDHGGTHMEWDMEVTEFEKNKKISWHTTKPNTMTNTFTLEPTTKGTIMTHFSFYELPYSFFGKLIDKLKIEKDVNREIGLELENTKKAIESRVILTH